jgi:hypothetical protein
MLGRLPLPIRENQRRGSQLGGLGVSRQLDGTLTNFRWPVIQPVARSVRMLPLISWSAERIAAHQSSVSRFDCAPAKENALRRASPSLERARSKIFASFIPEFP